MTGNARQEAEQLAELFRSHGLKATHQRLEIYRALADTDEHPDAMLILKRVRERMPSISFDTVYRTLRLLEEKGLVLQAVSSSERQRFDARMSRHHHFVCVKCGLIKDIHSGEFDVLTPPASLDGIGVAEVVRVEVRGTCNRCAGKGT